jgi:hypothetical protein
MVLDGERRSEEVLTSGDMPAWWGIVVRERGAKKAVSCFSW